jgi:preprotein translocase subunit YajC
MFHALFAQQGQPQGDLGFFGNPNIMFWMIGLMLLFWFIIVIPSTRRQKRDQQAMLAAIKRGTKVLTNSGIVGTVVSAKDGEDEVVIRSEDTRLRIKRNTIFQVLGSDEAEATKT